LSVSSWLSLSVLSVEARLAVSSSISYIHGWLHGVFVVARGDDRLDLAGFAEQYQVPRTSKSMTGGLVYLVWAKSSLIPDPSYKLYDLE
jgi:hypothetical protein